MAGEEDTHVPYMAITEQPVQLTQHLVADVEEGEEIIFEGTCDIETLRKEVKQQYCTIGMLSSISLVGILVGLVFCGPVGCMCANRVSNSWQLLLTNSRIYFTRKHHLYLCPSANTNIYVDLDDVNEISVQSKSVETGFCSVTSFQTTVAVYLKAGRRHDLLPHCCNQSLFQIIAQSQIPPEERIVRLSFTHCANAEEFVQAVKQQLQAIK